MFWMDTHNRQRQSNRCNRPCIQGFVMCCLSTTTPVRGKVNSLFNALTVNQFEIVKLGQYAHSKLLPWGSVWIKREKTITRNGSLHIYSRWVLQLQVECFLSCLGFQVFKLNWVNCVPVCILLTEKLGERREMMGQNLEHLVAITLKWCRRSHTHAHMHWKPFSFHSCHAYLFSPRPPHNLSLNTTYVI